MKVFKDLPSRPRIILLTPIVSFVTDTAGIWDRVIVRDIVLMTKKVGREERVEVIDMHPLLADRPDLLKDKIHPDAEGSGMIAKKMYGQLMKKRKKNSYFSCRKIEIT